jgi:hypothetical protein
LRRSFAAWHRDEDGHRPMLPGHRAEIAPPRRGRARRYSALSRVTRRSSGITFWFVTIDM